MSAYFKRFYTEDRELPSTIQSIYDYYHNSEETDENLAKRLIAQHILSNYETLHYKKEQCKELAKSLEKEQAEVDKRSKNIQALQKAFFDL